jgi:hypothetical protein
MALFLKLRDDAERLVSRTPASLRDRVGISCQCHLLQALPRHIPAGENVAEIEKTWSVER